jgi:hypothetical protein
MTQPETESDGTLTARDMEPCEWNLWVQPEGGKPFLLDWGSEERMKDKLKSETNRKVWLASADGQRTETLT